MEIRDPKLWAAFETYCEWLSLPRHFHRMTPEQMASLPETIQELMAIKFKKDFCAKFAVNMQMLSDWEKHPDLKNKVKDGWKRWTKSLTPNVMESFYRKTVEEGDAGRVRLWHELVEEMGKEGPSVNVNIGLENILKSMRDDGDLQTKNETKPDITK
jgi:hypothetical protein